MGLGISKMLPSPMFTTFILLNSSNVVVGDVIEQEEGNETLSSCLCLLRMLLLLLLLLLLLKVAELTVWLVKGIAWQLPIFFTLSPFVFPVVLKDLQERDLYIVHV